MDGQEFHLQFLLKEFDALRKEIDETKARIFRLVGFGLVVLPAAQSFALAYEIDVITIAIPLLVTVVALSYLSENHGLMRCGRYIREHIEPAFPSIVGWETWLERPHLVDRRTVDKYASYSFYLLFIVYYIGSVSLAGRRVWELGGKYRFWPLAALLAFYVVLGVVGFRFLIQNIQTATTTVPKRSEPRPRLRRRTRLSANGAPPES